MKYGGSRKYSGMKCAHIYIIAEIVNLFESGQTSVLCYLFSKAFTNEESR
jgi:hypothetical protein